MKCAWTAESSRMKSIVQLGLLCLSLLISSLHGEVVEEDKSMEKPINFDEPEVHQFEVYRVRRQTVLTETQNPDATDVVTLKEKPKPQRKNQRYPGRYTPLGDPPFSRKKREDKSRNNKRNRPRSGKFSVLASNEWTQQTAKVKKDGE